MNELLYKTLCAELWQQPLTVTSQELRHIPQLIEEARKQSVLGLVGHVLIQNDIPIGRENVVRLLLNQKTIAEQNQKLNRAVSQFTRFMQRQGIPVVIVKGQTFAALYPNPDTRQAGDVDFFCGTQHFVDARQAISQKTGIRMDGPLPVKHQEFRFGGIEYELHRVLTLFSYPRHQRIFDTLMDNAIEHSSSEPLTSDLQSQLPTLPPTENLLHQITHIYYHIIKEGIGIRQFCDMAVFLKHHHADIDFQSLATVLHSVEHYHPFCAMGWILVHRLGLDVDKFPYPISKRDTLWAKKILEDIEKGGNFGQAIVQKRGLQRNWLIFRHYLKYVLLTPKEILSIPFEKMLMRRWRNQTA